MQVTYKRYDHHCLQFHLFIWVIHYIWNLNNETCCCDPPWMKYLPSVLLLRILSSLLPLTIPFTRIHSSCAIVCSVNLREEAFWVSVVMSDAASLVSTNVWSADEKGFLLNIFSITCKPDICRVASIHVCMAFKTDKSIPPYTSWGPWRPHSCL